MAIKQIDAHTLKQWIEQDEALVIDVREPSEYASEHLAEATLIPLATISLSALPEAHPARKLVVHCRSGKRSQFACEQLLQEDPSLEIYNLEDGILGWMACGYPVHAA
ncbi:MAG: rhodanese-like domain-containing protein [Legionellaceae bacterium]|nr:rhodanese-like domain-containing protein [Legionellaceae bacterium]